MRDIFINDLISAEYFASESLTINSGKSLKTKGHFS